MPETTVPFVDMHARIAPIRTELLEACTRVIDSGIFVMGPETEALEAEFAAYLGVQHAIAVANGTAALQVGLLALGIGAGDEVITVANTFIATAEAITAVGATPVFVDIDAATYLMSPEAFEAAITERTRAVIPVHLYGLMADMTPIVDIARRHRISVIEDACQAHGARRDGAMAGTLSDVGCFSLYPAKNLGTIGEGGLAVTNDPSIAERMRSLRSHGELRRYHHAEPGWNLRLSELQSAAARVELRRLDGWNAARRRVARWYSEALDGLDLQLPVVPEQEEHVFHLYVVQIDDRDDVRARLAERGIATGVHYPVPLHLQQAYRSLGVGAGALPATTAGASRILSLPMYPEMTREQVEAVAEGLSAVLADRVGVPA